MKLSLLFILIFFLYALGETPVFFEKNREKVNTSLKPTEYATSVIGQLQFFKIRIAFFKRKSFR